MLYTQHGELYTQYYELYTITELNKQYYISNIVSHELYIHDVLSCYFSAIYYI